MKYGVDCETPPENPSQLEQTGWQFVAGYLGGRAAHTWQPQDFASCAAAGLEILPIWVSPAVEAGYDAGVLEGNAAISAMQAAGLEGVVALDVEDGEDEAGFIAGFVAAAHAGQLAVVLYGSGQTLLEAPEGVDAWWLASWVAQDQTLEAAPPDFSMWQYGTGPQFDYNVAVDTFVFATLAASS